jgi:predicted  nucleic acid-binding Zn-ribbon protein
LSHILVIVADFFEFSRAFSTLQAESEKVRAVELDLIAEVERMQKELVTQRDSLNHWQRLCEEVRKQHRDEVRDFRATVKATTQEVLNANQKADEVVSSVVLVTGLV